ncbi:STAS-like domain-containing protein [Rhodomicrobium lacus]|uniref:STAS-like domain-containing protein n=1 Tax=Rhodomicrobium lacus TaxID=2498452 RepID=UPI0026E11A7F|nr:STAS-like domain-containing protein [Rhodomicrobium lacus]WKW50616.1 STAS-like domain-containing protein [Rhodomicrobium lacus]
MFDVVGDFGEDKEIAASLRELRIKPTLVEGDAVNLDFEGVNLVTQSFVHALISDILRVNGENALDRMEFQNCSEVCRGIISTVVQYSLDTMSIVDGRDDC